MLQIPKVLSVASACACDRSYQTILRESDFKKEQTLPRGREGEVSGEGGFELGCSCSPTRNLLPPPSDSFFQRRLFFSREKKSASRRTANHTFRLACGVNVLQISREGKNHKPHKTRSLSENKNPPGVQTDVRRVLIYVQLKFLRYFSAAAILMQLQRIFEIVLSSATSGNVGAMRMLLSSGSRP